MPLTVVKTLYVKITDPVTVVTASLPSAYVGQPYSVQLVASGGVGPFSWAATGLPAGVSCSTSGLISGVFAAPFDADIQVEVTDAGV